MNIFKITLCAALLLLRLTPTMGETKDPSRYSDSIGELTPLEKVHEVFSEVEKSPDLKGDDLNILKEAEPTLISLRGKSILDKDHSETLKTFISLMTLLQGLSQDTAFQLGIKLLSVATADDYVRQVAVKVPFGPRAILGMPFPLHSMVEMMMELEHLESDQLLDAYDRTWISLSRSKFGISRGVQNLLHIPPEKQVSLSLLLPKNHARGTAVPWLLATLELAKTLPANKNNLSAIDAEIQYIKNDPINAEGR